MGIQAQDISRLLYYNMTFSERLSTYRLHQFVYPGLRRLIFQTGSSICRLGPFCKFIDDFLYFDR